MIIGDGIMLGAGGESASIFVTGLSQADTVTAIKDGKTVLGKWVTKTATEVRPLIPVMTSNTTPSGTAGATEAVSAQAYRAYMAFDGTSSVGDAWYGSNPSLSSRTYYLFDSIQTNVKQIHVNAYGNNQGTVNTAVIEYTEDGNQWKTLTTFNPKVNSFNLALDVSVKRLIGIRVGATSTSNNYGILVRELQVYGEVDVVVGGYEISPIKSYGTWTISVTDGTSTASTEILVDSAVEYQVNMQYKLYLYNSGDECIKITGGWNPYSYRPNDISYDGHKPSVTRKNTSILVSQDNVFENWGSFFAENLIDLTEYSTLNIHVIRSASRCGTSGWNGGYYMRICVSNTKADHFTTLADAGITHTNKTLVVKTDFTVSCDISSLTGEKYVAIWIAGMAASGENNVEFDKIWLE